MILVQIVDCIFTGMSVGFYAFLKVLPFYEELSGMKEQLIAWAIGIPVAIVSLAFLVPQIFKLFKRLFK